MSNQKTDPVIPAAAQIVMDIFDNELAGVKFPDISQDMLQQAADRVQALSAEQAQAEARLQAAREALQEGQDQLLGKCQRALSYARIYAEDDADLSRRLDAINIQRASRGKTAPAPAEGGAEARAAGKRGRRPAASGGALFAEVQQGVFPAEHNGVNGTA